MWYDCCVGLRNPQLATAPGPVVASAPADPSAAAPPASVVGGGTFSAQEIDALRLAAAGRPVVISYPCEAGAKAAFERALRAVIEGEASPQPVAEATSPYPLIQLAGLPT